ncbi:NPC intracellular cholesterol transporter 2-like isoform X2 [Ruditapes philippinarum]|uniref:NPC intracellular cholesterol transporter 2-like isoform X2 n=1 Tax=Ruditapes philippinarum TaxID=129788 RepID=UPI00295A7F71|nr:NPC intracellular cholesterol transporter 2-like isoform X2 [Ruditapes philippinarum]
MMALFKMLIVLSFLTVGYSLNINYKDCGSLGGKINSLDLSPCDSDPCVLHHGTNYTAKVNFTALENSVAAKTVVHGIIGGVPVPFPVPSDCCNNHNLKCPVTSGVTDLYTNYVYCSPSYPQLRLAVKWEVQDDNGKDIFCFIVPLSIQN